MKHTTASRLPSLILFALFIVVLLIALVAGVKAYSALVEQGDQANESRFANGLIANSIRSMDSYASVQQGQGPQGPSLVMIENTEAGFFETRIYLWQGEVLLEFSPSHDPYTPSKATKLIDSDIFEFTLENNFVHVTTDEGSTDIALRASGREVR